MLLRTLLKFFDFEFHKNFHSVFLITFAHLNILKTVCLMSKKQALNTSTLKVLHKMLNVSAVDNTT